MKLTRRAMMAGAPSVVPVLFAGSGVTIVGRDPFIVELARFRLADESLDAQIAMSAAKLDALSQDAYDAPWDNRHAALFTAMATQPATLAGWSAKLKFLATPADDPMFLQDRAPTEEWRRQICATLHAAAAVMRKLGKA